MRSKLGINQFPFDDLTPNADPSETQTHHSGGALPCKYQVFKLNTLYQYNVEFNQRAQVDKLKLYFEADTQAMYKVSVRVGVPEESTGIEEARYRRVFDENAYYQVCENAYKKEVINYFSD